VRTQDTLDALSQELQGNCGDFYAACKAVGVSPAFVRKWQKDDPKIDEAVKLSTEVGALQLESAAISRAVRGVDKDVYYQGDVVGSETQYSDGLLTTLLKGRMRNVYGADAGQTNVQVNLTNAIQIMPRANTYEEWLEFTTAKPAQLSHSVVDAEYTPILAPENDPALADIL
jgi:hypothetical protein